MSTCSSYGSAASSVLGRILLWRTSRIQGGVVKLPLVHSLWYRASFGGRSATGAIELEEEDQRIAS